MKQTLLLFASLLSLCSTAQDNLKVNTSIQQVGKVYASERGIDAKTYIFPERIYRVQLDTIHQHFAIQLRGIKNEKKYEKNGHYLAYDIQNHSVKWSKPLSFISQNIENFGGITLETKKGKSYCLDFQTGERTWKLKNDFIASSVKHGVGMGYPIAPMSIDNNELEGYNLTTGDFLWVRYIYKGYGWNESFYLNDSTLIVSASGLHKINVLNGRGWSHEAETGDFDYSSTIAVGAVGLLAAVLTGGAAVVPGPDLVYELCSNVLVDSTQQFYYASKDQLVHLSAAGDTLWSRYLPKKLGSKSYLFLKNDNLILVNTGSGKYGTSLVHYGTPFIASFNKNTGSQNFIKIASTEKREFIRTFQRKNNTLICLFNNRVASFNLDDGTAILDKKFDQRQYGDFYDFLGEKSYLEFGGKYYSLVKKDSNFIHLITYKGEALVLDEQLNPLRKHSLSQFYSKYFERNNLTFIARGFETIVINKNNERFANINASRHAYNIGNKLYDISGNNLYEIELTSLFYNPQKKH